MSTIVDRDVTNTKVRARVLRPPDTSQTRSNHVTTPTAVSPLSSGIVIGQQYGSTAVAGHVRVPVPSQPKVRGTEVIDTP